MIALEPVAKDEEMYSYEVVWRLRCSLIKWLENFLFTQFLATLHHFYKLVVFIICVAFFKDDGADFV